MNSDIPTVEQLRAMLALHEDRAKVQRQLDAIDEKLAALQSRIFPAGSQRQPARPPAERSAEKPPKRAARAPKPPAERTGPAPAKAQRNQFKGRVTEALAAAGEGGASLKELAEKLGTNYRNVAVWFATTGKKNSQIEKVGPARYRLAAPGATTAPETAPSADASAAPESAPEASDAA